MEISYILFGILATAILSAVIDWMLSFFLPKTPTRIHWIVASVGALILAILLVLSPYISGKSDPQYYIRITDAVDSEEIQGAQVTLEFAGKKPIVAFTDSDGLASLPIPEFYEGERAGLIVEVVGYSRYYVVTPIISKQIPMQIAIQPIATNLIFTNAVVLPNMPSNNDSVCSDAIDVPTDGSTYVSSFFQSSQTRWFKFESVLSTGYRINIRVPFGSPADAELSIYTDCKGDAEIRQDTRFSPDVNLDYVSKSGGWLFLKVTNSVNEVQNVDGIFEVSIFPIPDSSLQAGAAIIVEGRFRSDDPIQKNVSYASDLAYNALRTLGFKSDNILVLSTETDRSNVSAYSSSRNLQNGITHWAQSRVDSTKPLIIYLIGSSMSSSFPLDKLEDDYVTPAEIDGWLSQLEAAHPSLHSLIVIESCNAGNFITQSDGVSGPNRIVVSSTGPDQLAFVDPLGGAIFSDTFWNSFQMTGEALASFSTAFEKTVYTHKIQTPGIDSDGDGSPNGPKDDLFASNFSIAHKDSLTFQSGRSQYLAIDPAILLTSTGIEISLMVRNDTDIDSVWAELIRPSQMKPIQTAGFVVADYPQILLSRNKLGVYSSKIDNSYISERGEYRVLFIAKNIEGQITPFGQMLFGVY